MIKMNVADMFNIKLAKCGGMHLGGKLKAVADGANIPCVIGSMIESSLGSLANYNFATAYEMKVGGLSAFQMITNDYDFGLKIENGKLIRDKELPGLGYPDEKVLEKEFE